MNPYLPGLGLLVCAALAVRGMAMVRDRGPIGQFASAEEGLAPAEEVPRAGAVRLLDRLAAALAPTVVSVMGRRGQTRARRMLDLSGRPKGMTFESYTQRKSTAVVVGATLGVAGVLVASPLVFPLAMWMGWAWVDIGLSRTARVRQARIDRDLPDFLDILAVSVAAGIAFRPAMARVAEALGGPVGEEVDTALHQMQLGAARRQALEALRTRNDSDSLSQLVSALLQAEELGVPLAGTLIDQAADMRRSSYQKARRRAQRAAPRISLVVSLLIVPGAILLIFAALFLGSEVNFGAITGG